MLKVTHDDILDSDNRFVIKSKDDSSSFTIDLSSVMKKNHDADSEKSNHKSDKKDQKKNSK
ncbi:MAG: hypothetical protein IJ193_03055 [Bacilli bacterium]|nr:hypothetical protein [Bacilli bacterium]